MYPDTVRKDKTPQKQARLAGLVIVIAITLVVLSVVGAALALLAIPDQRTMMTPVAVVGAPEFQPEVESRVKAADPARGEALFKQYACAGCHAMNNNVGPDMKGIGERAATRRPPYSAAAYLYESITQPNAYIVPGYPAGVMVQNFKQAIPEDELYDLIAWLLTHQDH
jgi:cytochrome c2